MGKPKKVIYIRKQLTGNDWMWIRRHVDYLQEEKLIDSIFKNLKRKKHGTSRQKLGKHNNVAKRRHSDYQSRHISRIERI